jgi:hypothetical protein
MKNVYLIGGAILGAYVLHKIISNRNKTTLMSMEAERQKPVSFKKPVPSSIPPQMRTLFEEASKGIRQA